MDRWFPVETKRLFLREFTVRDEADIHGYAQDPRVVRYATWGPNTAEETNEYLAAHIAAQENWPRDEIELGVELRMERKLIGGLRLAVIDKDNRTAEIGYVMNPRYWNNGYASEAAAALLHVAFSRLNLHRVIATCDVRNVASVRVLEKLGMRREAHFRKDVFQKGEWRDSYLYAILADERR